MRPARKISARGAAFAALFFIPKHKAASPKMPIITKVFTVTVRFPDAEKREYVYFSPSVIAGENKLNISKAVDKQKTVNIGALFLKKTEIYIAITATA